MSADGVVDSYDDSSSSDSSSSSSGGSSGGSSGSGYSSFADTLLQGAQIVGGVLLVAGAATGNKRLMQAGAILGIGSSVISGLTTPSGETTGKADRTYGGSQPTSMQSYADMGASDSANMNYSSARDSQAAFGAPGAGLVQQQLAPQEAGYADVLSPADNGALFQTPQTGAATTSAPITTPDYSLSSQQGGGVALQSSTLGQSTATFNNAQKKLNAGQKQQSLLGKAMGWLNDKDNAQTIKLGTGLISGAMQGYQQEKALEEQRRARDEQRQYVEDQRTRYNRSILDQNLTTRLR